MDEDPGITPDCLSVTDAVNVAERITDDQELFLKVLENLKHHVNLKPDKHSVALPKQQTFTTISDDNHSIAGSGFTATNKDIDLKQNEMRNSNAESLFRSDTEEPGTTTVTVSDKTKSLILQKIIVTSELEKIKAESFGAALKSDSVASKNVESFEGQSDDCIFKQNQSIPQEISQNNASDKVTVTVVGLDRVNNYVTEKDTTVFNSKLVELIKKPSDKKNVSASSNVRPVVPAPAIQLFTCSMCDYYSENKNYLKQHMDYVHNNERPYKCPYCEYAGKRSHALREHLIVHSNERPFQCQSCNATFRKKGHLTNHIKLHNSKRLVKCPLCKILIYDTGENGLDAHLKNEHDTERLYGCDLCDHVAANEPEILEHLKTKHKSKLVAYKCDRCPFQTSNTVDFNCHMDAHSMANMNVQIGNNSAGKVVAVATLPAGETLTEMPNTAVKIGNMDEIPSQSAVIKPVWIKCSECGFTAQDSEVIKKHMLEHLGMEVMTEDPKHHVQQILTPINAGMKPNSPHTSGMKPPVLVPVTNVENLFPQHAGKLDMNSPILVPVSDPAMLKSLQSSLRRTTASKLVQLDPTTVTASLGSSNIMQQTVRSVSDRVFLSARVDGHVNETLSNKVVPSSMNPNSATKPVTTLGVTSVSTMSSPTPTLLSKQPIIPLQKHQMEQLLKNPNFKIIPVTGPQQFSSISPQFTAAKLNTMPVIHVSRSSEGQTTIFSAASQDSTVTLASNTTGVAPIPSQAPGFKLTQIPIPRNLTTVQPPKLPMEILSLESPIIEYDKDHNGSCADTVDGQNVAVSLQEGVANIQQLIEEQNRINKQTSQSVVKVDVKAKPELAGKQKVLYYLSPVEKQNTSARNVKNAGFTHDSNAGRFKCTLCGYTCEYQRTIKAHVWKHSGNKNIDYPMFQNGPLSIYDDGQYARTEPEEVSEVTPIEDTSREVASSSFSLSDNQTYVATKATLDDKTNQSAGNSKLPSFIVYDQTRISNVAPALANLLAARTMANMSKTNKTEEEEKSNQKEEQDQNPQTVVLNTQNEVTVETSRSEDNITIGHGLGEFYDQRQSVKLTDNVCVEVESEQTVQTLDESNVDSASSESNKSLVPRQTGANVVVEAVNSVNTSCGYTGLQSQQNSPRISLAPRSPDSGVSELTSTSRSGDDKSSDMMSPIPNFEHVVESSGVQTRLGKRKLAENASAVCYNEDSPVSAKKSKSQSLEDSAVTLLSLLKKGPNYNPACPPKLGNVSFVANHANIPSPSHEDSNSGGDADAKPKSGISTSLLAVIEQLRERSKSDVDEEKPVLCVPSKKASKRRSRRGSMEENESAAGIENVEQFDVDGQVKFRCKLCHYTNESTLLLKQHMRLHKPKQEFECSLCDLIAESSEALQDHMIQHCKVRTYQCKLCNSAFNYKSQLRAHMRMHNDQDILLCDFCDFETRSAAGLKTHIKSHLTKPPYKCDMCKEEFITSFNLRIHKREGCYTSIDQLGHFKCDECDFKSLGRREMKNHQKTHVGKSISQQQKACPYCDFQGVTFDQVQQHITDIHGESKPMKCEMCGFVAVSIRSLKSHMKRHVNDQRYVAQPLEQYKCNLCGYVCHHLPSLKSHMWRHAADQHYSYEFTNDVINAAIDFDSKYDAVDTTEVHVNHFKNLIFEKMKSKGLEGTRETQEESAAACCWVTFRCCQCGFETINKAELNMHMTTHSDVIKWTLDVSEEERKQDEVPMVIQEQVVPFVDSNKSVPQIMNA